LELLEIADVFVMADAWKCQAALVGFDAAKGVTGK